MLDIEHKRCRTTNIHHLALKGEFDLLEAEKVEMALCEVLVNNMRGLVVDATNLIYLDSSAIGLLLTYHMKLQEMGARMAIAVDPNSYLPKKLANLGVFNAEGILVYETPEEAKSGLLKEAM